MRTKTLLIAAAALAAAVTSSQAQTVYSQNIVGYVNTTFTPSVYSAVVTPLQATNGAVPESVITGINGGDTVLIWVPSQGTYNSYVYLAPGTWLGPSGPGSGPTLNAGQAFFYLNGQGSNETNTFTGSVTLTNTVTFNPSVYGLVGSISPITCPADSTNLNLPVSGGDAVLLWDPAENGFDNYVYLAPGTWLGPSGPGAAPTINVGQAFFYLDNQGGSETWTQNDSYINP